MDILINAAGSRPVNSYEAVTWRGILALLETSKIANIKKFIHCSSLYTDDNSSAILFSIMAYLEKRIRKSGVNYLIYRCPSLFQPLLNQYAIPILSGQSIQLYPPENNILHAYMDSWEFGRVILQTQARLQITKVTLTFVTETWHDSKIVQLCERIFSKRVKIIYTPSFIITYASRLLRIFKSTQSFADRLEMVNSKLVTAILSDQFEFTIFQDVGTCQINTLVLKDFFDPYYYGKKLWDQPFISLQNFLSDFYVLLSLVR